MKRRSYGGLLLLLLTAISCKKFIDVEAPVNKLVYETAFADDKTATATVNGLYSKLLTNFQNFSSYGLSLYPALSADELYNTAASSTNDLFTGNALQSSVAVLNDLWKTGYSLIYQANDCYAGLNGRLTVTDSLRKRLMGETRFVRAFAYFYLVNLFGDVPLAETTDYAANAQLGRTPVPQVYARMVSDLQEAIGLLPPSYATGGRYRPNKWAAYALLARVYLYQKEWAKAEEAAGAVIGSGTYALVTNLNNVFLNGSNEAIWQLNPQGLSFNTNEGNQWIPASATVIPPFAVTNFLLNAFETGDWRKAAWLKSNTVSAQTYYYPNKYKVKTGTAVTECPMYLRLAEQYLIRAEARAMQHNVAGAQQDLNTVRARAGLLNTTAASESALLSAILHERQVELFTEFGHRWFDLRRWGTIDAVLGAEKVGWMPTAALYPLPYAQLQLNVYLVQNAGY